MCNDDKIFFVAGEKRTIEGGIVQKIDCRPVANKHYIQLKKAQRIEACKPKRTTVQLQTPVNSIYKPVSITKEEVSLQTKLKVLLKILAMIFNGRKKIYVEEKRWVKRLG